MGLRREADSSEQKKILNDLNLQEEGYLKNENKVYWRPNNEIIDNRNLFNEFYSKVSQKSIVKTYLLNPRIFVKTSMSGLGLLVSNPAQPQHLGNYSKENSSGKQKTVIQGPWGLFLNYLAFPIYLWSFISAIFIIRKNRTSNFEKFLVLLVFWIPLVYIATFVAGGINDFVKHNLSIYLMISILFLLCCLTMFEAVGKNDNIVD